MDAKDLLQKAWVFEVLWLLLNFTVCLYVFPSRMGLFMQALPLLTTLIGGQGFLAAAGPEIKRLIESKNGSYKDDLAEIPPMPG